MKHSVRISKISKERKPLGYRKIVVRQKVFWWKAIPYGSGINILDENRKQFYSDYWGSEATIRPKYVAEWIEKTLDSGS